MTQEGPFDRMAVLYGRGAIDTLAKSRVLLFGVGGVGGHCAQALARCGIGHFLLVDADRVSITNINRQAVAMHSTVGELKVEVMRRQILDINPQAQVDILPGFYLPEDDLGVWDWRPSIVIDAIDTISAKIDIALRAQAEGIRCISCMGAGNKLDPSRFEAADLYDTSVCPLCRVMRSLGKKKGIHKLRVIYSQEPVAQQVCPILDSDTGRPVPGSVAYVTASAGLLLAHEAVKMLLGDMNRP